MFENPPLIPFFVLLFIIVFIFLTVLAMKNKFTLFKFYLTMISLVSVIGLAIGYGIAIYNGIQSVVISDTEYLAGQGMYSLDQCKQPNYATVKPNEVAVPPTDEEIQKCEETTKQSILTQRSFSMKQNVIGGLVWGTLALILFLIHYSMLVKKSRDEAAE